MDKLTWHVEKRKVKDLIPYSHNPRQISKEQLVQLTRSLEKFDYVEIAAIQPDNTIIAGHMRVKAMMQLGWGKQEIDVRVPNRQLTLDEMREYLIRSNKNVGDWDWEELANNFDVHDLHEWGFTPADLEIIIDKESLKEEIEEKEACSLCGQTIKKKKNGNR